MKILLVNKFLFPKGGDAISTIATGDLLLSKGHQVVFWGMQDSLNPSYPYHDYFVENVDFNKPGSIKKQARAAFNLLYSFEAKSKIEKLIKIERPDIVHLNNYAHQISPSILHVIKKYNLPVVMTMRDYKLVCPTYNMLLNGRPCEKCKNRKYYECFLNKCTKNSYLKSFLNMSEMYFHHSFLNIYQLIDIFISPSFFLKSKCEEMGFKAKIKFLPNFVNLNEYAPSYVHDEKMIIYFGRISPEKGISTLIRAMKGLSIKLKIIGDGPWVDSLRVSIKNLNLENVNFLGYKTGEDLKGEIAKSMFSVIPSEWYENNPRSVLESFALGKAVVGSRIGGIPELIQEGKTGLTFEPGNVEELKAKIKYLAENSQKSLEMGKAGRVFLEEKLSSETHYQRLMDIYREATQV